ncbi:MAG: lipopolysaccharide biosynthesis protein [Planctomycetota bacterium]
MLEDALKRLTKHSVLYALGPAVHKAIGFALLPLVTVYVGTTANYGITEMAAVSLGVAGQLFGINLLHGLSRFYPEYATDEERGRLVTTCGFLLVATTGIAWILAYIFRAQGAELLFDDRNATDAFVAVGGILFFQTSTQVGLRYLQILERSVAYGVVTTTKLVCEVGLKLWFLVGLGLLYMGVIYSVLVGEALVACALWIFIARRAGLSFSGAMARRLIRYSYPLILSGVCMFVLHQADRFVLKHYLDLSEVGKYALGYKLGSMASVVILEAFGMIWFNYVFGLRDEEHVRLVCRKVLTYFTLVMCFASLALAVFAPEIVRWMAAPEYFDSHRALPIIAAGYVFWAIFQIVHTVFFVRQKTVHITFLVAAAAVLNLALNAWLAPRVGFVGAAWATLATFAALAGVGGWFAERLFPVRYEIGRVVVPIVLAVGLYLASIQLPAAPIAAVALVKSALVLALPAALWWGGYLDPLEKEKIKQMSKSVRELVFRRQRTV